MVEIKSEISGLYMVFILLSDLSQKNDMKNITQSSPYTYIIHYG